MEQFEQLLTCAICLDRYRNPKLLPCQHSFCMEPCMEGLVDYVRRQVKCPECRAEHRIPYQGVQAFPTNVTLQRFLELHIEISGELPDPTSGQVMERCAVCSEKAYCCPCVHCDKRICPECKSAHMDILRREIARINNQIRRGLHRLQDVLSIVEKNTCALKSNCSSVNEEVEEINRRLAKALKDRTEHLKNDIDRYQTVEMRTLDTLKDNLELEISNIQSNCELADKHMTEIASAEWDDRELMDAKEIFLRTVEFIRNFEYGETQDWSRKVRFVMAHDPNQLVLHVAGYGDLNISHVTGSGTPGLLQPPSAVPGLGAGLMRSKSDHRLAYRQQLEDAGRYGEPQENETLLGGRRFGERPPTREVPRYGRTSTAEYEGYDYDDGSGSRPARSRFRSRFSRHADNDSDTEQTTRTGGVRFSDHPTVPAPKERERVLDTEDVARGPLSGISRLCDSPRVMKRLQEGVKKKEAPPAPPVVHQPPKVTPAITRRTSQTQPPQRQLSEDDEISRIKKQNKGATSSTTTPTDTERPVSERVAALKQRSVDESEDRRSGGSPTRSRSQVQEVSSEAESDESVTSLQAQRKTSTVTPASRRSSASSDVGTPTSRVKTTRSTSSDSSTSSDGSAVRNTGAAYSTDEVKQKILSRGNATPPEPSTPKEKQPFQSRFLPASRPASTPVPTKKDEDDEEEETETSSEEETESSSEEEPEPPQPPPKKETKVDPPSIIKRLAEKEMAKTDIGPLLARSAQARDNNTPKHTPVEEPVAPRPYTSRFLNKSRSSAVVEDDPGDKDDAKYPSGRSRYAALKDRRTRLARSRSTHNLGDEDAEDIDEPMSPTTQSPAAYLASRGYGSLGGVSSGGSELSRSRSSHALKSRESSPERPSSTTERDGAALSSWARYLKNKYGNRSSGGGSGGTSSGSGGSTGSEARRLSLGLSLHGNDDEPKNTPGSPNSPRTAQAGIAAGSSPRSQYLQKRRQLFQIGGRGSEPGYFTWPRGVAVGPDNSIVVADSSNHRVQVFDSLGNFLHEFGTYGAGDGEFDCLAGVAVNRIGQYIIADRYNHRVQVFDPAGRFLRTFGSQGSADGRFNYPWGVTTDALGFIYVCDKENHRVQVFQSDGTFVGKFGSCGSRSGQLDHPHYIAVSSTNRVVVSDSNNHRIQIFDVNGRVLTSFGSEGIEEGQFKFPRGVAVDDQGYICVADSGNNRIQIFHPDGTFLRAFGCWGSGDAEFKGLEGVAISSNGSIVVCDRENHRIQVF